MKRILSVLLAAVLGASIITGCTSKKDQDTNSETNGNSGENKTIKVLS